MALIDGGVDPGILRRIQADLAGRLDRRTSLDRKRDPDGLLRIGSTPGQEASLLVTLYADETALKAIAAPPFVGLLEVGQGGQLDDVLPPFAELPAFFSAMTCRTALAAGTSTHLAAQLGQAAELSDDTISDLTTCLRELLVNAVVHGSLGLTLEPDDQLDQLVSYSQQVDTLIADPAHGDKRVYIGAWIADGALHVTVADQGPGFVIGVDPSSAESSWSESIRRVSGRGLELVDALALSLTTDPASASVTFSLPAGPGLDDSEERENEALRASLLRSVKDCIVVVADDQEIPLTLMRLFLESAGYHNVIVARDGAEALEAVLENNADLAVLDVEMPGLSGFEVIERLRARARTRRLPVIVVSAHGDTDFRNKALSIGATDVLTKPIVQELLQDRVRLHLENRLMMRELNAFRRRVGEELDSARRMQQDLFPTAQDVAAVSASFGVRLWTHHRASSELGGDLWRVDPLGPDRFSTLLVDFTGHGVGSALNTFRLHALLSELDMRDMTPSAVLSLLNARLYDLLTRGQFATAFYAVIDTKRREVVYASAGAPEPFVGRWGSAEIDVWESRGLPLGVSQKARYADRTLALPKGGYLFLASDALAESPLADSQPPLGVEGAAALVGAVAEQSVDRAKNSPLERLLGRFYDLAEKPLHDDLTLLWMEL